MFSLVGIVLIPDFRPPDVIAEFHPHHEPDQISENRRFVEPSGNQFLSKLCMRDGSPRPAKLLHDPRLRRRAPQTGIAHQLMILATLSASLVGRMTTCHLTFARKRLQLVNRTLTKY